MTAPLVRYPACVDAWSAKGDPVAFPCTWRGAGQTLLPAGTTGLVYEGKLHGFVAGCFGRRYTDCLRKLAALELPFAELYFKERDGSCASHGMIWREAKRG